MRGYWKVPFRQVFVDSFPGMLKQTLWCHLVMKVFPNTIDMDSVGIYALEDRQYFLTQYSWMFDRAYGQRIKERTL